MSHIPPTGWYVEVETGGGAVHRPTVLQDPAPQRNPKANGLPSIRIPVKPDAKWEDSAFEGATLRVWFDGARQPIDELEDTVATPQAHVLIGRGGLELLTRVETAFDQKEIHLAAQDLIDNNTTYTSNVDTPSTSTETNTTLATWTSNADWLSNLVRHQVATDPWFIESGTVKLRQTCFTQEGESSDDDEGNALTSSDTSYSDGVAAAFGQTNPNTRYYDFTVNYDIPEGAFEVAYRNDATGTSPPVLLWEIDINRTGTFEAFASTNQTTSLDWHTIDDADASGTETPISELAIPEGTHRIKVESDQTGSDSRVVDVIAPRDNGSTSRFTANYTDDNSVDSSSGHLDGPEFFPDEVQITFDILPSSKAVTGARAEATLSGGDTDFTHYLSNDQGSNFTSGDNSGGSFETDSLGVNNGPGVTYKAGLSRTGTTTGSTPLTGINDTELQSVTLKADLSTMPLVVNQEFDGHLLDILKTLADQGDFVFAFERDGSTESVEWTQPGSRSSTKTPTVAAFESRRTTAGQYDKIAVYGSAQTVTSERFESNHGSAVNLSRDRLHELKEVVEDPDTGERFVRQQDYTMDYNAGEITVLAAGDMADASVFVIDYTYQTFGEFDNGGGGDVGPPQEIPGLTSDRQCEQAARIIVDEVEHPRHEITFTVPGDEAGWSVVDAIDPTAVPTFAAGEFHINDIENAPEKTVVTGADRERLGEVVADIRQRVGAVSRKA